MKSAVHIGLDISDHNIELVAVKRHRSGSSLGARGMIEVPAGTVDRGTIYQPDTLVTALRTLLTRVFGPDRGKIYAGVSMPENKVFSAVFKLPLALMEDELNEAVYNAALDYFPIELHECIIDKAVVGRGEKYQEILFVAMEEAVVLEYARVLARVGITPRFFETEALALARALVPRDTKEPVLIADMGARSTNLLVHDRNAVRFSSNIALGGNHLTTQLETKLNIAYNEAERLKREVGLDPSAGDGRVMLIIQNPLADIVDEVHKTKDYYEEKTGTKVNNIILAGGTSLMPSITDYFASNFPGVSISIGDALRFIAPNASKEARSASVVFSAAAGLALRTIHSDIGPQINLLPGVQGSQTGVRAAFGKARSLVSSLFAMVTRAKKSTAKKGASKKKSSKKAASHKKEKAAVVEPLEEVVTADEVIEATPTAEPAALTASMPAPEPAAEPDSTPAPEPKPEEPKPEETPVPEPLTKTPDVGLSDSTLGDDSVLAQISPAITETMEDIDNVAGTPAGERPPTNDELYREQLEGVGDAVVVDDGGLYEGHATLEETGQEPAVAPRKRGSRILTLGLIILVTVLFLAAAGGVYMFMSKGNTTLLPAPIAKWFEKKAPDTAPVTGDTATAPASVGVTFVVGTTEQEPAGGRAFILAHMLETDVDAKDTFDATGEGQVSAGRAEGYITVVNELDRQFTFVATTRFLTDDGVLFRLDKASVIAPAGETRVKVSADEPGAVGDVGPANWTIPGLSADLQTSVYGKTTTAMTGGSGTATIVSVDDLAEAKAALEDRLWEEAQANFSVMVANGEMLNDDLYSWTELSMEAPEEGIAAGSFEMGLGLRFRALTFDESAVLPLLDGRLAETLPEGESADAYALGAVTYSVDAYDIEAETAVIRAEASVTKN